MNHYNLMPNTSVIILIQCYMLMCRYLCLKSYRRLSHRLHEAIAQRIDVFSTGLQVRVSDPLWLKYTEISLF